MVTFAQFNIQKQNIHISAYKIISIKMLMVNTSLILYEPRREKTGFSPMRKQRRRSASQLPVTAKLISAFVFATRIVQFIFYLNPKFQASTSFLCLYRSVCVGPVRKPHCWFSHEVAQL